MAKSLEAMGANIESKELQDKIKAQGQSIINSARAKVPVRTGGLRESIGFITTNDEKYRSKVLIGLNPKVYNYFLGIYFEYGTRYRETKKGYDRGKIGNDRPFFRPAVDENRNKVEEGIGKILIVTISNLAKKYGLEFK